MRVVKAVGLPPVGRVMLLRTPHRAHLAAIVRRAERLAVRVVWAQLEVVPTARRVRARAL